MADVSQVDSRIERVEVYRSQALLTRRARVEAHGSEDTHTTRIGGLPLALRDDSVRVTVVEGFARVLDVHVEWDIATRDRALRTKAEEKLRELARKRADVSVARDRATAKLGILEALKPTKYDTTKMPDELAFKERHPLKAWFQLADFVREDASTQRTKIRQLDRQERDLVDQIFKIQDDLNRESAAELAALSTCRKAARVVLAGATGPVTLELSYMVPGATWVPEYELRVLEGKSEAELVMRALVAQRTGEDWAQVALSFSTANLMRSAETPELESWRIGKVQPPKPSGWRELPDSLDELFVGWEQSAGSLPPASVPGLPDLPDMPLLKEAEMPMAANSSQYLDEMMDEVRADEITVGAGAAAGEDYELEGALNEADEDFDDDAMTLVEECEEPAPIMDKSVDMASTGVFGGRGGGGPPEPPMQSAPAPASMPPPSPGGVMRSAIAGKKPAPRRRSKGKKKMAKEQYREERKADDSYMDTLEMEMEMGVAASRDALTYSRLRMQPPENRGLRGQLKATTVRDQLRERVVESAPELGSTLDQIGDDVLAKLVRGGGRLNVSMPRHAVSVADSAGHFACRYGMESPGALPSDGQLHALTLVRRRGAAERVYRCVPSEDDNVYLMALFQNPLEVPLLAGPVRVYRGGDFVVTAPLATTPPAKTLTVNLGVEPSIKIARNTHYKESTGGLFGSGSVLWHQVEIEVHNKLSLPARIEVFERVPFSEEEDIKVEVTRSQPQAEPYDQRDRGLVLHGGHKFTLELAAGEKKTCVLEYQINLPSKRVLAGGNRRD